MRHRADRPTPMRASERAFWERATLRWERYEPQLLYSLASVDPALFRAVRLRPGQRVLDVGCGSGEPALTIAQLVSPRGTVLGVDLSSRMLAIARLRARFRGVTNARFRRGDVGRLDAGRVRFHAAVSRFGLMFAEDIPSALANIRSLLRPGGRAAFAVWGPYARNPVAKLLAEATRAFLRDPPPPPEQIPHPMRLARPGLLARLLRRAGYREVTALGVKALYVYGSVEEFVAMNLDHANPIRDLYVSLGRRDRQRLRARLARGIRRYQAGPLLRTPGFAWVVSGRR